MDLSGYLVRRAGYSIVALLGITLVVFVLLRLTGDPASAALGLEATPEQVERFRQAWGFDRPIAEQYVVFLGHLVQGDLGLSSRSYQPALGLVLERMWMTVRLALGALVITLVLAAPLGIIAALRKNSVLDGAVMTVALLGQSIPVFFLGIVLILFFSVRLSWLPAAGGREIAGLVLPSLTLGLYTTGLMARLLRSNLSEVLAEDYIRTARSKGASQRAIVWRHALRNAALPLLTVLGLQAGNLFGGAVVTEAVFGYPGLGLLLNQAIFNNDYAVVQAAVLVSGLLILIVNLLTDLCYSMIDPRIRYG